MRAVRLEKRHPASTRLFSDNRFRLRFCGLSIDALAGSIYQRPALAMSGAQDPAGFAAQGPQARGCPITAGYANAELVRVINMDDFDGQFALLCDAQNREQRLQRSLIMPATVGNLQVRSPDVAFAA